MLFEKVLRRLCPCYYTRCEENEGLCGPYEIQKERSSRGHLQTTGRFTDATIGCRLNLPPDSRNFSAINYWGGSIDLIHPQPLYTLPSEHNELIAGKKNLLRPPLYWKRTLKTFGSKGPPVVQEHFRRSCVNHHKEIQCPGKSQSNVKRSETVGDIQSPASENIEAYWVRSPGAKDLSLNDCKKMVSRSKKSELNRDSWNVEKSEVFPEDYQYDSKKFRVIPDISYGVIVFSAAYNSSKNLLLLKIDRLENLALKGRGGNTYKTIIKLSVSPSDKYVKSTKVLKKSTSPEVKEDFSLTVKDNSGKVVRLSVFDTVSLNPFSAVGHAMLSLDGAVSHYPKKFRMKLYRHTRPHITPGNLALSLSYRPEDDKFAVLVDKAKNLILQKDKNVKLSTYVKGTLYSNGVKMKSKKSLLINNSKDPRYNSIFTFNVEQNDVDDLLLVLSVRLKSFVKDSTIGRVILGPFFITDYKKLTPWGRVFLKREFVSHWFRLYL
ncbi:UNVERIFIED_CONTAM: hypothetical protein PYX00_002736 [Menopon gallinae]|uniref:C2 domain-containing protein n=1 Tax=Menopon gallinae TaxID=328185 RepID=A0AAW2HYY7_9NEOP